MNNRDIRLKVFQVVVRRPTEDLVTYIRGVSAPGADCHEPNVQDGDEDASYWNAAAMAFLSASSEIRVYRASRSRNHFKGPATN